MTSAELVESSSEEPTGNGVTLPSGVHPMSASDA